MLLTTIVLTAIINNVLYISSWPPSSPYSYPKSTFICLDFNKTHDCACSNGWRQLQTNYVNGRYLHSIKLNDSLEENISTIKFRLLYVFPNKTEQDFNWHYFHIKNKCEIINKFNVVDVREIYIYSGLYIIFLSLIVVIPLSIQIVSHRFNKM